MNSPVLGSAQISPARLTQGLRSAGVLDNGEVSHCVVERRVTTSRAILLFVRVKYSGDAPSGLPGALLYKLPNPASPERIMYRELEFYKSLARDLPITVLPRCLEAVATGRETSLLFEDLSLSHFSVEDPLPPRREFCEMGVGTLAEIHARWWGDRSRIAEAGGLPDREFFDRESAQHREGLHRMASFLGDRLPEPRRRLLEHVIDGYPRLLEEHGRTGDGALAGATIIHGDAHWNNLMFPRARGSHDARLVDWETWGGGFGTDDIANLIALYWDPDRRGRLEEPLLRLYHRRLLERGVTNYDWQRCWLDYRVSVIRNALFPVELFVREAPAKSWWPILQTSLCALEDLETRELVDERGGRRL